MTNDHSKPKKTGEELFSDIRRHNLEEHTRKMAAISASAYEQAKRQQQMEQDLKMLDICFGPLLKPKPDTKEKEGMKITSVEKIIMALIVLCIIVMLALIPSCIFLMEQAQEEGLKGIVEEMWYGEKGERP